MSMILDAARLARKAHEGQLRKYTARPYIEHPARVAGRAAVHPLATEVLVAAAFLHDTIEDTKITFGIIHDQIDPAVAVVVQALTNPSKGSQAPRAERKKMDREHLVNASPGVKIIKMLDRVDNLQDMDNAPPDFKKLYGDESLALIQEAIGDADGILAMELENIAIKRIREGERGK